MSKFYKAQTEMVHTWEFTAFIRAVGEARSKQEEDEIIQRDLGNLRKSFETAHVEDWLLKECVVRLLYAEMLGHPAKFAHILCVNLSASPDLLVKRTGYLGTWLTIAPQEDIMILIVSNLLRDMNSSNFLHTAAALTAASKVVRRDLICAIKPEVVKLLDHSAPLVRKKAVIALHALYRNTADLVDYKNFFLRALGDPNPAVEAAALSPLLDIVQTNPELCRDLTETFIKVLEKVVSRRLSGDYEYQRVPGPWFQIQVMRILAALVCDSGELAAKCEYVLTEVITRADTGSTIGYAVACEAISLITRIPTIPSLIELSVETTAKMFATRNVNLRYTAIQALSNLARINTDYLRRHQEDILECLGDSDEMIRRKTTFLLLSMCNEGNVDIIVKKLIKYLNSQIDNYVLQELTQSICRTVERFSMRRLWYISTMNRLLLCAAEHVPYSSIQGMLKLIVEGDESGDEASDVAFRLRCVEEYFGLISCSQKKMPDALCRVAAWVVGEYGFLATAINRRLMVDGLCDLFARTDSGDARDWIIMAVMKIVASDGVVPENVKELIERFKDSRIATTQQRCYEFSRLTQMLPLMKRSLPLDRCCEEVDIEETLSFLNPFVQKALLGGAKPYEKRPVCREVRTEIPLCIEKYETPQLKTSEASLTCEVCDTEAKPPELAIRPSTRRWGAKTGNAAAMVNTGLAPDSHMREVGGGERITLSAQVARTGATLDEPCGVFGPQCDQSLPATPPTLGTKCSKNKKLLEDIFDASVQLKKYPHVAQQVPDLFEAVEVENKKNLAGKNGSALSVHMEHVREERAVGITLFMVGNVTVNDLVVNVLPPSNCTLHVTSHSVQSAKLTGSTTITMETLKVNQSLEVVMQLLLTGFPNDMHVRVKVVYRRSKPFDMIDVGKSESTTATMTLQVGDFLRPASSMTTDTFGEMWLKYIGEYKTTLHGTAALTLESISQLLMERASLRVVEMIGNELIVAAVLPGTDQLLLGHVVLVDHHCANATFRAQDKRLAEFVVRSLDSAIPLS
ncbi:AP-1/4 adapter complex gamma/epsilon subunit,putative [Trypanosoma brucei gambiense DAL972]|uniref:AP-4 complex subunit epsilon n=1 Tax=Trypanosoma brucei gambiense (strain MHOM/CI/86/DAL972) TaxID=679716 RepID=C9ZQW7_TRYB9|nr:AP-1/4 adapter complex gamma/epsilon subunit,putative [Trypanosoma brucei gambiense DAL972]CBH11797.1 AP-1/4 adapter complex gamma/epsilon subunit,putative [Trypanosoma brucei gambiense DAL972]|eukprot:XP_011774082.1 AP-1/4 adapter complex gamma/epsilon subunit,putative [Trypanosoma brucei gambiense DAL972]